MPIVWLAALLALAESWSFPAGPPEPTKGGGTSFPMTAAEYEKFVDQTSRFKNHVHVHKTPAGLSPNARYGYNFVVSGTNRGWILDGDDDRGWVLYLDMKGDGDLSQVESRRFEKVDGQHRLTVEVSDGEARWPVRFAIRRVEVEGQRKLAVEIGTGTVRRGVMDLDGRKVPFQLSGSEGHYNLAHHSITLEPPGAARQRYRVSEKSFNVDDKTYEFAVDPLGRNVVVTETAFRPERASLEIGTPAPAFDALKLHRGKMVLVEFWSTQCGPCRFDAPKNAAFYQTLDHERVEFLGVSSDESAAALDAFLKEFGVSWQQIREPMEGPVHKQYRVEAEPTYFLVGPSGEIVDKWMGDGQAVERVKKALAR